MNNRYEVVMGFNTKQVWIYDSEDDVYIDPPTDVLEQFDDILFHQGKSAEEAERWLEELVNNEEPEWLHDGNEYPADDIDI